MLSVDDLGFGVVCGFGQYGFVLWYWALFVIRVTAIVFVVRFECLRVWFGVCFWFA